MKKDLNVNGPCQCVVTDMTMFWYQNRLFELTLYVDIWNNEIVSYGLSSKREDPSSYINGLEKLLKRKEEYRDLKLILHSDQGSVYSSKSYNELLPLYNIIRSLSRAGTTTDNATMESINGWLKDELFNDFKINNSDDPIKTIEDYINFFNYERPAYALNYLTLMQYSLLFK